MGYVKRRIRQGRGVKSPTEDSLSQNQINMLLGAGYNYSDGRWRPPGSGGALQGAANAGQGAAGGAASVGNKNRDPKVIRRAAADRVRRNRGR